MNSTIEHLIEQARYIQQDDSAYAAVEYLTASAPNTTPTVEHVRAVIEAVEQFGRDDGAGSMYAEIMVNGMLTKQHYAWFDSALKLRPDLCENAFMVHKSNIVALIQSQEQAHVDAQTTIAQTMLDLIEIEQKNAVKWNWQKTIFGEYMDAFISHHPELLGTFNTRLEQNIEALTSEIPARKAENDRRKSFLKRGRLGHSVARDATTPARNVKL